MYPAPPKREDELAEHVEMWQDKMRRLESHGKEFKLAPVFKINALRMLMASKAKEYFDLWEAVCLHSLHDLFRLFRYRTSISV